MVRKLFLQIAIASAAAIQNPNTQSPEHWSIWLHLLVCSEELKTFCQTAARQTCPCPSAGHVRLICTVVLMLHVKVVYVRAAENSCFHWNAPACWQTRAAPRPSTRPQRAFASAPPWPQQYAHGHYCPPQRWDLRRENSEAQSNGKDKNRKSTVRKPAAMFAHLACFGSNASKAAWSCPDLRRPKRWSWCSCILQSPR